MGPAATGPTCSKVGGPVSAPATGSGNPIAGTTGGLAGVFGPGCTQPVSRDHAAPLGVIVGGGGVSGVFEFGAHGDSAEAAGKAGAAGIAAPGAQGESASPVGGVMAACDDGSWGGGSGARAGSLTAEIGAAAPQCVQAASVSGVRHVEQVIGIHELDSIV